MASDLDLILARASVIPVLSLNDVTKAAPLARALAAGGLGVIEMTLRTPDALDAMARMKAAEPELIVGMGTLRHPRQVQECRDAGADFLVSPGLTPELAEAMIGSGLACLPGVATPGEAMQASQMGFAALKFFPAEQSGGAAWLRSIAGPLPDLVFCPTGSITEDKAPDYLNLPNVACIGGSWVVEKTALATGDWDAITANAKRAEALKHR
jgi:2-dehydro-3-deoxyphosphogluconate aldolase/(4S)-4-hydroxy-2-oxoglutarate aldolase